jgi:glyoxalase/bleomycin resistance protein/dioxygenase superfamily protein
MSLGKHPFDGPVHHLAYLVDDLEAAVEHLVTKFGAGPFFVLRDVAFEQLTSRGEPATFAHDSAFGQCGAVPIEVIQVKRLEPEHVRAGFALTPPQLHHTAYVVAPEDLEAARADLEDRGVPAFLHAITGEIDSTMHDAAATLGHHVELHADCLQLREVFGMVRDASGGWDGSDPLRSVA